MAETPGESNNAASSTTPNQFSQNWRQLQTWSGHCHAHLSQFTDRDKVNCNDDESLLFEEQDPTLDGSTQTECDSILFSTLTDGDKDVRRYSVPPYVICLAMLAISDACDQQQQLRDRKFMYNKPIRLSWYFGSPYLNLYDGMCNFVREREPEANRSYLKSAHVRLLHWVGGRFEIADSCVIDKRDDWIRHVPYMINQYCSRKTWRPLPFYLEIHSDFECFKLESYSIKDVEHILELTQLENFRQKTFWSKKFLKKLFNQDNVSEIIKLYITTRNIQRITTCHQSLTEANCDQFVEWIWPDRIRLFATAIRCRIDMDSFHNFKEKCGNEIDDYHIPVDYSKLRSYFSKSTDADMFRKAQKGFRPYDFPDPKPEPGHEHIEDNATKIERLVPINFVTSDPIGRGGFGNVYKVTIHPDFHALSPDRNEEFALKIISDSIYNPANNEVKAWQLIAEISHPHITPLYASWLQNNQCFMLSPLAEKSLRDLLEEGRIFNVSKETEWLLKQLEGLIAGIHHIHHTGRISLDEPGTKSRLKGFSFAWHHDLKPANILIFKDSIWKIGDFGAAKIRQLVSGKPRTQQDFTTAYPGGDGEYGAPDRYSDPAHVGRSYDIWSVGCILLEVLLWAFGAGGQHLEQFRTDREQDPCDDCLCQATDPTPTCQVDSPEGSGNGVGGPEFWYRCRKRAGQFHLKTCVKENLRWVKETAERVEKNPLLSRLCESVEKMLKVNPTDRPSASDIKDTIGELRVRASFHSRHKNSDLDADIETQPDTYVNPRSRHTTPGHIDIEQNALPSSDSQKRKADNSEASSPIPINDSVQHAGAHLLSEPRTGNGMDFLSVSGDDRPSKRPRLKASLSNLTNQDTIPDSTNLDTISPSPLPQLRRLHPGLSMPTPSLSSQGASSSDGRKPTTSGQLVKKRKSPASARKPATDNSPSKSNASRSNTF